MKKPPSRQRFSRSLLLLLPAVLLLADCMRTSVTRLGSEISPPTSPDSVPTGYFKGIGEPSAEAKIAGAVLGTGFQRTGRMVAIYVKQKLHLR